MFAGKFKSVHNDSTGVDAGMIAVITVKDVQKLNPEFNVNDKFYPRINGFNGIIMADGKGNFVGDVELNTQSEEPQDEFLENEDQFDYEVD